MLKKISLLGAGLLLLGNGCTDFLSGKIVENLPVNTLTSSTVSNAIDTLNSTSTAKMVSTTSAIIKKVIKKVNETTTTSTAAKTPEFIGVWEAQFGNGELAGMRRYEFKTDGTFKMTGYPAIDDMGTYTVIEQTGATYKIELKTKTGYSPSKATITVQGNSLSGLDNVGTYQRVTT